MQTTIFKSEDKGKTDTITFYPRELGLYAAAAAAAAKLLQLCPTLCDPIDGAHCLWDSPGKNTGVGCHFLLQCMNVENPDAHDGLLLKNSPPRRALRFRGMKL